MMTQSDLLELAQRGNPQAIASLMNLVLEPKGVVAKAMLKDSCLQIFFASEQILSQQTIVNFVKNGLSNLSANSIRRVKVFAQKQGQEVPVWTDEFQLANMVTRSSPAQPTAVRSASAQPVSAPPSPRQPVSAPPSPRQPASAPPASRTVPKRGAIEPDLPFSSSASSSPASIPPLHLPDVNPPVNAPRKSMHSPKGAKAVSPQGSLQMQIAHPQGSHQGAHPQGTHSQATRRVPKQVKRKPAFYLRKLVYKVRTSNRSSLAMAIAVGAFIIGGSIALAVHFQKGSGQQTADYGLLDGSNSQMLIQSSGNHSPDGQEAAAKTYLAQMNQAQQSFYQSNNRFAANLEELERSAAIVSRSSGYSYKLVVRDETQSVLTAVPKTDKLRSYTATVLSAQSPQSAGAITTILCGSNKPSTFPPVLPQTSNEMVQCPADSIQIVN